MLSAHNYKLFYCKYCNHTYEGSNYKAHCLTRKHHNNVIKYGIK
jgi:hypothetical protein